MITHVLHVACHLNAAATVSSNAVQYYESAANRTDNTGPINTINSLSTTTETVNLQPNRHNTHHTFVDDPQATLEL